MARKPQMYLHSIKDLKAAAKDPAAFQKIMASPWRFGEAFLKNKEDGKPRKYWPNQIEDMECTWPLIIHQDGTEVGKSVTISTLIIHFLFTTSGLEGLCVAPELANLLPIFDEILWQIDENEILQHAVAKRSGIILQPHRKLKFAQNTIVRFCPAGETGQSYKSLHVNKIWLDEASEIKNLPWSVLYQRMLPGAQFRAYSWPNGRTDTMYYKWTSRYFGKEPKEPGEWKVFHFPQTCRPDWNAAREKEKLEQFGGRDNADYQHMVLGLHGKPQYAAFDMESFHSCLADVPGYEVIEYSGHNFRHDDNDTGRSMPFEPKEINAFLADRWTGRAPFAGDGTVYVGADLGYTSDPAEIVIWRDIGGRFTRIRRLHLTNVPYPVQARVLAAVIRYYVPRVTAIDNGGNGVAVIQQLKTETEYQNIADREDRIIGVDFGGVSVVDIDADGKERKQYTKELMTSLINHALRARIARLPKNDLDAERQYTNHEYTKTDNRVKYKKGNDHVIDADRCAFYGRAWENGLRDLSEGYVPGETVIAVAVGR